MMKTADASFKTVTEFQKVKIDCAIELKCMYVYWKEWDWHTPQPDSSRFFPPFPTVLWVVCFFLRKYSNVHIPGCSYYWPAEGSGGLHIKRARFPPIQRRAQQVSPLSAHNLNWRLQQGNQGERTPADAELFFSCHFGQKNDRLSG